MSCSRRVRWTAGRRGDELAFPEPLAQFVVAFLPLGHGLPGPAPLTGLFQERAGPGVGLPGKVDEAGFLQGGCGVHQGIGVRRLPSPAARVSMAPAHRPSTLPATFCTIGMTEVVAQVPADGEQFKERAGPAGGLGGGGQGVEGREALPVPGQVLRCRGAVGGCQEVVGRGPCHGVLVVPLQPLRLGGVAEPCGHIEAEGRAEPEKLQRVVEPEGLDGGQQHLVGAFHPALPQQRVAAQDLQAAVEHGVPGVRAPRRSWPARVPRIPIRPWPGRR